MAQAKYHYRSKNYTAPAAISTGYTMMLFAVLFAVLAQISSAEAQQLVAMPPVEPSLSTDGLSEPTAAWSEFCGRLPDECETDATEPPVVELDEHKWKTIVAVNGAVNANIAPLSDLVHWGTMDHWDYPDDGFGDCEDYQLLKRKLLVKAGFPRRALRMAVVLDEDRAGHAVLMVRTDRGEFILDNKREIVLPWLRTGYIFLKREGDVGHAWASLGGQSLPAIADSPTPDGQEHPWNLVSASAGR
jgi:predicted transglutaminase-like cysteine proteinase